MLSFLLMIFSSSAVLQTDTEGWMPKRYPDSRSNFTQCHTWPGSAFCDPDHVLTAKRIQTQMNQTTMTIKNTLAVDQTDEIN
ncbi:hypothetical protein LOAG_11386 [Loa loa]|uniref:Uncharacterized protein n=1 Tax=Loa loa TaxID=7209 RepID=A0A1S0TPJ8_LOALO|nr:hypothetical protein LOAG_11386 [Loa loa]EFO17113.1 hypothetical protein LOAG_11386 [Loa loa]